MRKKNLDVTMLEEITWQVTRDNKLIRTTIFKFNIVVDVGIKKS